MTVTYNALELAQLLSTATSASFIVLDVGSTANDMAEAFPSLDIENIDSLGMPCAIRFESFNEAQSAFEQIIADLRRHNRRFSGVVHLVCTWAEKPLTGFEILPSGVFPI